MSTYLVAGRYRPVIRGVISFLWFKWIKTNLVLFGFVFATEALLLAMKLKNVLIQSII